MEANTGLAKGHNKAPDVTLELTERQAQFLLKNCNSNMAVALSALQGIVMQDIDSAHTARRLVAMLEQFKEIRELLTRQGVKEPGT